MNGAMRNYRSMVIGCCLLLNMPLTYAEETKILIYGGDKQDIYLGCLNCSPYEQDSIHYSYGRYGSKHSGISIFNRRGLYGATISNYSPCNPNAIFPPILKNKKGETFGRLVLNAEHYQANDNKEIQKWLSEYVCKEEEVRE